MKHKFPVILVKSGLLILFLAVAMTLPLTGCSKKDKPSRGVAAPTGTPGGGGTGGGGGGGGGGNPGDADALDLTWGVRENASQADMEFMANRIKTFAGGFWNGTEGQGYLRNQTLVNNSLSGDVIVKSIKGPLGSPLASCSSGAGGWQITLSSGKLIMHGFLHELGHAWVGPFHGEEYNCVNGAAGICIMGRSGAGGEEGLSKWCDPENCVASQQCWTRILSSHAGWTHPGPGGTVPACNVTIQ
ncbi:MAG: hypothetical protein E3J72_09795 [Planctomycetota bacterium]|nr:MAG: hypothetical protein E3J72_09795 [Planctomycetota bacterium]